jgi:hypothetical protein
MLPRQRQHQEEAAPSSSAACSLFDLLALGPAQELIWSGLSFKDRQRLRETCRGLKDEVERSCTALKFKQSTDEAESLVKLSGRLPGLRTLRLETIDGVQALSLDPPPPGEQHANEHGTSAPSFAPSAFIMRLPHPLSPLPSCLQLMRSVSRGPGRLCSGHTSPISHSWWICVWTSTST